MKTIGSGALGVMLTLVVGACGAPQQEESPAAEPTEAASSVDAETVKQEMKEAAIALKDYGFAQKADFEAAAAEGLESLDEKIAMMESHMAELDEAGQEQWQQTLEAVKATRQKAADARQAAAEATEEGWAEARDAFAEARAELAAQLDNAKHAVEPTTGDDSASEDDDDGSEGDESY